MNDSKEQRTTLVLTNVRDEDGTIRRAVSLTEDGGLVMLGHDVGPGVERIFGCGEYEFEHRLSAAEVSTLRRLLGVATDGDLLAAIGDRFASTRGLEAFAQEHGITGEFWNRIGD